MPSGLPGPLGFSAEAAVASGAIGCPGTAASLLRPAATDAQPSGPRSSAAPGSVAAESGADAIEDQPSTCGRSGFANAPHPAHSHIAHRRSSCNL